MTKRPSRGSARGCVPQGLCGGRALWPGQRSAARRRHLLPRPPRLAAALRRGTGLALLPLPGAGARCAATLRARQRRHRRFTAAPHREQDWSIAPCLEVGVAGHGHTMDEALANLAEAAEPYLEE